MGNDIIKLAFQPTASQKNYGFVRSFYMIVSEQYHVKFREQYNKKFHNMDDVYKGVNDLGLTLLHEIIGSSVKLIREKFEIYSIDESVFIYNYLSESTVAPWYNTVELIEEKYMEIVSSKEEMEEYRRVRKAGRGRVVGGGFGLQGAIKGMATAGTINMATGMAHSAANAIGNMGSAIGASVQKSKLFKCGIINQYADAFDNIIYGVASDVMNAIEDTSNYRFYRPVSRSIERAKVLIENLESGAIPTNRIESTVDEILDLNPFAIQIYKYIIKNYGDSNLQIQHMAEQLFMNDIGCMKQSIMEEYSKTLYEQTVNKYGNDLEKTNYEKALKNNLEQIQNRTSYYGIQEKDEDSYSKSMKDILKDIEIEKKYLIKWNEIIEKKEQFSQDEILRFLGNVKNDFKDQRYSQHYYELLEEQYKENETRIRQEIQSLWDQKVMDLQGASKNQILDALRKLKLSVKYDDIVSKYYEKISNIYQIQMASKYSESFSSLLRFISSEIPIDIQFVQENCDYKKINLLGKQVLLNSGYSMAADIMLICFVFKDGVLAFSEDGIYVSTKTKQLVKLEDVSDVIGIKKMLFFDLAFLLENQETIKIVGGISKKVIDEYTLAVKIAINIVSEIHTENQELTNIILYDEERASSNIYVQQEENSENVENNSIAIEQELSVDRTEKLEKIKELVNVYENKHEPSSLKSIPKMIKQFGINEEIEVFYAHDDTLLHTGKTGFLITNRGIYCKPMMEKMSFFSYDKISKDKLAEWKGGELYNDKNESVLYNSGRTKAGEQVLSNLIIEIGVIWAANENDEVLTVADRDEYKISVEPKIISQVEDQDGPSLDKEDDELEEAIVMSNEVADYIRVSEENNDSLMVSNQSREEQQGNLDNDDLDGVVFCSNCGEKQSRTNHYCLKCGNRIIL